MGPSIILWDRSGGERHRRKISRFDRYEFDLHSVSALGLPFLIESKLIPGSIHLPLIQFARSHQFAHYWFIEYDVRFTGDWKKLFEYFEGSNADFLSSHVMRYSNLPKWFWWKSLSHRRESVADAKKIRSFNPIFRISHQALRYIDNAQKNGWVGHNEVLIATLLHQAGFKIRDFGGIGEFVAAADHNRFYLDSGPVPHRDMVVKGSLRFRPAYRFVWFRPRNKLYHPVKWSFQLAHLQ